MTPLHEARYFSKSLVIADICPNQTTGDGVFKKKWPILLRICALFGVHFTGLNKMAVYQNGQISGMSLVHQVVVLFSNCCLVYPWSWKYTLSLLHLSRLLQKQCAADKTHTYIYWAWSRTLLCFIFLLTLLLRGSPTLFINTPPHFIRSPPTGGKH